MIYLCRNKESLVVYDNDYLKEPPTWNEDKGVFEALIYDEKINHKCRYGEKVEDPEHLYDSIKVGTYIKGEHIKYMCDECHKISKLVKYTTSPFAEEIYDKIEYYNYCEDCYEDECLEI